MVDLNKLTLHIGEPLQLCKS